MSFELFDAIENSEYMLGHALPHFQAGSLPEFNHVLGLATLYRRRGVAQVLTQGVADPLRVAQMQSASVCLYGMPQVPQGERITSRAACFWDAVGGQYWDAAADICSFSPMVHNPKREHEDDFLYVAFLMQRYFLTPADDAPPQAHQAHVVQQQQRLARWEDVLDGGLDARLDLCHALADSDADAFAEAIVTISEQENEVLLARQANEVLRKEDMAWQQPVWPEGLALLRLAARDGLADSALVVPRVPPLVVSDNPYQFDPNAWRTLNYQPQRRPN